MPVTKARGPPTTASPLTQNEVYGNDERKELNTVKIRWPTIITFWKEGEDGEPTVGVVTADLTGFGAAEALIVFAGPRDAQAFQEQVGCTEEEGFTSSGLTPSCIAALLRKESLEFIARPGTWIEGDGGVEIFEAGHLFDVLEAGG